MNKKMLTAAVVFVSFAIGYVPLAGADVGAKTAPAITQSFASKEMTPGRTWRIYLKASDPKGEMKNIYAIVDQPGIGEYPLSIIRIKKEDRKELSGYIYLNTSTPAYPLDFVNLRVTVQIQDGSGNFSKPAVFDLAMNSRYSQEAPPRGVFKNQALGPIMVNLRVPGDGNNENDMP